ncbi:MAG: pyridoxamine 5'-phosphate oxidase family protein [Planctomycetes bacterium]|nr:pyridoxamine 5'-phosphate oxidase family protein [Planctomycetota bacterium]
MSLANYFENVKGIGILGTADPEGKVDLAIYTRPYVIDEETVAFLMENHLSHRNVTANPHAAYLFLEDADGYNGLRMHLTKTAEETDPKKIEALRRRSRVAEDFAALDAFLVQFKVDEVRPLAKERSESALPSAVGEPH